MRCTARLVVLLLLAVLHTAADTKPRDWQTATVQSVSLKEASELKVQVARPAGSKSSSVWIYVIDTQDVRYELFAPSGWPIAITTEQKVKFATGGSNTFYVKDAYDMEHALVLIKQSPRPKSTLAPAAKLPREPFFGG